jgi:hypothetical protein
MGSLKETFSLSGKGLDMNNIALAMILLAIIAGFAMFRITDSEKVVLSIVSGISGLATGVGIGIEIGRRVKPDNEKGNSDDISKHA